MTKEELSRIALWIISGLTSGFGLATPDAVLELVQPEVIGAAMVVIAAVWRAFRPPVVS